MRQKKLAQVYEAYSCQLSSLVESAKSDTDFITILIGFSFRPCQRQLNLDFELLSFRWIYLLLKP